MFTVVYLFMFDCICYVVWFVLWVVCFVLVGVLRLRILRFFVFCVVLVSCVCLVVGGYLLFTFTLFCLVGISLLWILLGLFVFVFWCLR